MGKEEIKEIIREVFIELKGHEGPTVCCGGLAPEQRETVKGWTKQGDLFTPEQQEGLKTFADALIAGKKYFIIGIGIVAILALRDFWRLLWDFISVKLSIG